MVSVTVTAFFAAVLALIQVVFTMRVGAYRFANSVSLGDGGDGELLKRMRAHGNFVETVPMALLLLLINEINGMSTEWLYGLGVTLVVARLLHYAGIAFKVPLLFRMVGMMGTLLVIVAAAVTLLM